MGGSCAFRVQPWERGVCVWNGGCWEERRGFWEWETGAGAGVLGALGAGTAQPLGSSSLHWRINVPAAAPGAGLHLQVRDQGLESARRAAWTCPTGRRRGVLGGSGRKIPFAWGSVGEEAGLPRNWARLGKTSGGKGPATQGLRV